MPPSLSKVAKDYRRSAINRYDEAILLFEAGKCTGAIYLEDIIKWAEGRV